MISATHSGAENMKMSYTCYDADSDEKQTVEVEGETVGDCEAKALETTGLKRIASARVIEGDLSDEIARGALKKK